MRRTSSLTASGQLEVNSLIKVHSRGRASSARGAWPARVALSLFYAAFCAACFLAGRNSCVLFSLPAGVPGSQLPAPAQQESALHRLQVQDLNRELGELRGRLQELLQERQQAEVVIEPEELPVSWQALHGRPDRPRAAARVQRDFVGSFACSWGRTRWGCARPCVLAPGGAGR